jgi:hypothetical protein
MSTEIRENEKKQLEQKKEEEKQKSLERAVRPKISLQTYSNYHCKVMPDSIYISRFSNPFEHSRLFPNVLEARFTCDSNSVEPSGTFWNILNCTLEYSRTFHRLYKLINIPI